MNYRFITNTDDKEVLQVEEQVDVSYYTQREGDTQPLWRDASRWEAEAFIQQYLYYQSKETERLVRKCMLGGPENENFRTDR